MSETTRSPRDCDGSFVCDATTHIHGCFSAPQEPTRSPSADPADVHSDDAMLSAQVDVDLPETRVFGQTIRAMSADSAQSYPELLERTLDMAREALTQRVADAGFNPVGAMYLRIDIEQMAEERS